MRGYRVDSRDESGNIYFIIGVPIYMCSIKNTHDVLFEESCVVKDSIVAMRVESGNIFFIHYRIHYRTIWQP